MRRAVTHPSSSGGIAASEGLGAKPDMLQLRKPEDARSSGACRRFLVLDSPLREPYDLRGLKVRWEGRGGRSEKMRRFARAHGPAYHSLYPRQLSLPLRPTFIVIIVSVTAHVPQPT